MSRHAENSGDDSMDEEILHTKKFKPNEFEFIPSNIPAFEQMSPDTQKDFVERRLKSCGTTLENLKASFEASNTDHMIYGFEYKPIKKIYIDSTNIVITTCYWEITYVY